jgi:hypothetical protein
MLLQPQKTSLASSSVIVATATKSPAVSKSPLRKLSRPHLHNLSKKQMHLQTVRTSPAMMRVNSVLARTATVIVAVTIIITVIKQLNPNKIFSLPLRAGCLFSAQLRHLSGGMYEIFLQNLI